MTKLGPCLAFLHSSCTRFFVHGFFASHFNNMVLNIIGRVSHWILSFQSPAAFGGVSLASPRKGKLHNCDLCGQYANPLSISVCNSKLEQCGSNSCILPLSSTSLCYPHSLWGNMTTLWESIPFKVVWGCSAGLEWLVGCPEGLQWVGTACCLSVAGWPFYHIFVLFSCTGEASTRSSKDNLMVTKRCFSWTRLGHLTNAPHIPYSFPW